ncbi:hypothetical protein CPHO_12080 [Corynebacterium phocae]|uniref:Uncharacterized protein n=1 Tax=Corynebacterium phocae TaxID=161895 RepID=A0A1L7D5T5_9CORY|nr:hypothetical protein [Corynebacterium phocae]APT93508.1 hypothetical protein CPHO_12080 [Corynebacterium phocae]KAA8720588.1 hypothetical protein F4V58_11525 [Corynebacterium phocae]
MVTPNFQELSHIVSTAIAEKDPAYALLHTSPVVVGIDNRQPWALEHLDKLLTKLTPEASVQLAIIQLLTEDEKLKARLQASVKRRKKLLPKWALSFRKAAATGQAVRVDSYNGEETQYIWEVKVPGAPVFTFNLFLNETNGGAVEDFFPLNTSLHSSTVTTAKDRHMAENTPISLEQLSTALAIALDEPESFHHQEPYCDWPHTLPLMNWARPLLGEIPEVNGEWLQEQRQAQQRHGAALGEEFARERGLDEPGLRLAANLGHLAARCGTVLAWHPAKVKEVLTYASVFFARSGAAHNMSGAPAPNDALPYFTREDILALPDMLEQFIRWSAHRTHAPEEFLEPALRALEEQSEFFLYDYHSGYGQDGGWDGTEDYFQTENNGHDLTALPLAEDYILDAIDPDIQPQVTQDIGNAHAFFAHHVGDSPEAPTAIQRFILTLAKINPAFFRDESHTAQFRAAALVAAGRQVCVSDAPAAPVVEFFFIPATDEQSLHNHIVALAESFYAERLDHSYPEGYYFTSGMRDRLNQELLSQEYQIYSRQ